MGIFCFLCAAAYSNYSGLYIPIITDCATAYSEHFAYIHNSFPALIPYVVIGAVVSMNFDKVRNISGTTRTWLYVSSIIGLVLLYVERFIVTEHGWNAYDDVYLSLLIPCISVFLLTVSSKWAPVKDSTASFLGAFSTVTYCAHFTLSTVLKNSCPNVCGVDTVRFIVVLIVCFAATVILTRLAKDNDMRFVRYAF